jgi:hypothetical protein
VLLWHLGTNVVEPSIPLKYSSISEAKRDLFDLLNTSLRFIESAGETKRNSAIGTDDIAEEIRIIGLLEQWKILFEAFADQEQHAWSNVEVRAANILRTNFLAIRVRIAVALEMYETAWDKHESYYEEIVRLAEKVLSGEPSGYFSFEVGIISPLHFVAFRCRWPTIRRKALSLLYLHPRREGLYDSRRLYNIFKRVMLVEEFTLGIQPGQEPAPDNVPPEYATILRTMRRTFWRN